MPAPLLATKLHVPAPRPKAVPRPHLVEQLEKGLYQSGGFGRTLTLLSAPAGFGKTTLVSEWIADVRSRGAVRSPQPVKGKTNIDRTPTATPRVAWLSLDEGERDVTRFLAYLVAAVQTIEPNRAGGILAALQSPQPPPGETILAALLAELNTLSQPFFLILDDYHAIDSPAVDNALTFLLEHRPPQMHLVMVTREDPHLPLARLRNHGQLVELRAAELRFSACEAADFLQRVMGLPLSSEDVAVLEKRTEGWVAGLQLAALALQATLAAQEEPSPAGGTPLAGFIQAFSGTHRFVLDYLLEEVLQHQPEDIHNFLLRTSILERLCGPLCDAVLGEGGPGQPTLEFLERANLFTLPLDDEGGWYRYHHLFADLLRQRLAQHLAAAEIAANHLRASQWYEDNGLGMEAFHHAVAAQDVARAEHLIEEGRLPLHFPGAVSAILGWLASLPRGVLDARPSLWWRYAALLLINGQTSGVEEKLQAAEAALVASATPQNAPGPSGADELPDDKVRNLVGQIAAARATLALTRYQVETMLMQSRRALQYLHPTSLFTRSTAYWTLGYAYLLQGDRPAARRALTEAISLGQASGAIFTTILATIGLGNVQEADNQLMLAAGTYRRVLEWAGEQPQQIVHEAHLGLARIAYERNDLEAAERHAQQSLRLARQYERGVDRYVICELFLARLRLTQGDMAAAEALLAQAEQAVRHNDFVQRLPEMAAVQVLARLRQGNPAAAAQLAQAYELPLSRARVYLAQGEAASALEVLAAFRHRAEAQGLKDECLRSMVLQVLACHAQGEKEQARQVLAEALALAEPEGFVRIFVDEGEALGRIMLEARSHIRKHLLPYVDRLLAAFAQPPPAPHSTVAAFESTPLEPLSPRELEILRLLARGFSNWQIGEQLFLALSTVKGHNQKLFAKLGVQRRAAAIARARELGLL